jgi:hypothetical protein
MNRTLLHAACTALALWAVAPVHAQEVKPVYRCPGNPPLYTDQINAKDAAAKGCKTLDSAPVTVVQSGNNNAAAVAAAAAARPGGNAVRISPSGSPRPADARVDPSEQRARDSDARKILEAELRREEERLATLQKEFNGGEPERRGDERNNFEKYQERVAEMRAAIDRKESDIAAIRRELAKLPGS